MNKNRPMLRICSTSCFELSVEPMHAQRRPACEDPHIPTWTTTRRRKKKKRKKKDFPVNANMHSTNSHGQCERTVQLDVGEFVQHNGFDVLNGQREERIVEENLTVAAKAHHRPADTPIIPADRRSDAGALFPHRRSNTHIHTERYRRRHTDTRTQTHIRTHIHKRK